MTAKPSTYPDEVVGTDSGSSVASGRSSSTGDSHPSSTATMVTSAPVGFEGRTFGLVTDDWELRKLITDNLVADGANVTYPVEVRPYDVEESVVLIDLGHLDAERLLAEFHAAAVRPALIVILGLTYAPLRARLIDRIDDYITQPVIYGELATRIVLAMKRHMGSKVVFQDGPLTVDTVSHQVTMHGRDVYLSAKEFALLELLIKEPTRMFPEKVILREVWHYVAPVKTRTLGAHASRLRRKLDPDSRLGLIHNVHGHGYSLRRP